MENRVLCHLGMTLPLTIATIVGFTDNNPVFAQLTPDNTLGAESSIITPQQLRDLIQGGAIRDDALFHSFDEFNVGSDRGVFFDLQNNADILNIFTRVTGSNSSNILGTLGILRDALNSNDLGDANLFLLNPNGITFGQNASLQLNGSFFATTADGFGFDDFTFSASGQETPPPLLTISIPRFASFRDNPEDIAVNQSNLTVNQGQNLSLVGGNVTVTGNGDVNTRTLNLNAADGRIEIGSVSSSGSVSLTQTDAGFVLGYEGIETFGDLSFNQVAYIDTSGEGGGSIQLQGRNITLSDETQIFANTLGAQTGGGIVVNSEQLVVEDNSSLTADVSGSGLGGNLNIETSQLRIQDGAIVSSSTFGEGDGGNLTVNASDSVQVIGTSADGTLSRLFAIASSSATGNAGDLAINTSQLLVQDGALVSSSTLGEGDGSNLSINATDYVEIIGTSANGTLSRLFAIASSSATGNAGDLTINTSQLLVQDGAQISAGTFGEGNGGNLTVNASDSVQVIGFSPNSQFPSGLFTPADNGSTGDAGDLTINTSQLLVQDGALVSASTSGEGNGGNLTVNATDSVQVIGTSADGTLSRLLARVNSGSTGNAGDLTINTSQLLVQDGAQISAGTFGEGNGGNLTVNASDSVQVIGFSPNSQFPSGLFTPADNGSTGDAGDLTINTSQLLVQDGALVSASTSGEGNGGNLSIDATDSVQVIGTSADGTLSRLFAIASSSATGDAGDLTINTSQLLVQDGAQISSGTSGEGNGGNLTVNASDSVQIIGTFADGSRSSLLSRANSGSTGNGGNLTINTSSLLIQDGAEINAGTLGEGNGGNLTVNASDSIQVIGTSSDGQFPSALSARPLSTGDAGDLNINTSNLLIQDGAFVSVSTRGAGNSGNLTVNASDSVQVIGRSENGRFASGVFTQATSDSEGNAGDLIINTSNLLVQDGAQISAGTFGEGNGGNLTVNATDSVQVIGRSRFPSGLFTTADNDSTADAGDLTINTSNLLVQDGAQIGASTFGAGNGSNIKLDVDDTILIEGTRSGIFSTAESNSTGNAGSITIDPQQVTVRDGGTISVQSFGTGKGGNLTIISDNLTLDNGSITAQTVSTDGGNVTLDIADLLLLRNGDSNALISATAGGEGNGGNLTIDTTFLVAFPNENSDITANASQGRGGNINITADGVLGIQFRNALTDFSDITATSDVGIAGTVILNTPETQINQEQVEQPEELVDSSNIVTQSACYNFGGDSQFAHTGRGGVPQIPGFIIRNDVVDVELVDEVLPAPPPEAIKPYHRTDVTFLNSEGEEIKPAMGAVLLPNGMVEFVDYNPAEVYRDMYREMYAAANCSRH